MNITVRVHNFKLTEGIERFAHEQLRGALARINDDVVSIDVFLKDINGPRGGIDKEVLIRVRLRSRQQLAVIATHANTHGAICKGVKKAKKAIRRNLRKSRSFGRNRMRDALRDTGLATAISS